jgi:hypothetical protein
MPRAFIRTVSLTIFFALIASAMPLAGGKQQAASSTPLSARSSLARSFFDGQALCPLLAQFPRSPAHMNRRPTVAACELAPLGIATFEGAWWGKLFEWTFLTPREFHQRLNTDEEVRAGLRSQYEKNKNLREDTYLTEILSHLAGTSYSTQWDNKRPEEHLRYVREVVALLIAPEMETQEIFRKAFAEASVRLEHVCDRDLRAKLVVDAMAQAFIDTHPRVFDGLTGQLRDRTLDDRATLRLAVLDWLKPIEEFLIEPPGTRSLERAFEELTERHRLYNQKRLDASSEVLLGRLFRTLWHSLFGLPIAAPYAVSSHPAPWPKFAGVAAMSWYGHLHRRVVDRWDGLIADFNKMKQIPEAWQDKIGTLLDFTDRETMSENRVALLKLIEEEIAPVEEASIYEPLMEAVWTAWKTIECDINLTGMDDLHGKIRERIGNQIAITLQSVLDAHPLVFNGKEWGAASDDSGRMFGIFNEIMLTAVVDGLLEVVGATEAATVSEEAALACMRDHVISEHRQWNMDLHYGYSAIASVITGRHIPREGDAGRTSNIPREVLSAS